MVDSTETSPTLRVTRVPDLGMYQQSTRYVKIKGIAKNVPYTNSVPNLITPASVPSVNNCQEHLQNQRVNSKSDPGGRYEFVLLLLLLGRLTIEMQLFGVTDGGRPRGVVGPRLRVCGAEVVELP